MAAIAPAQRAPFQPLTRCQYVLATFINVAKTVKAAVLTVFSIIGAAAALGLSKKMNSCVENWGFEWTRAGSAFCLTLFGSFCPSKMNQQFQAANA